MIRHHNPLGTTTESEYDYKGRLITQIEKDREGNFSQAKSWHYNAFHLLSETDEMGIETHYEYNYLGQLIRKTCNGLEELFFYTPEGYLETKIVDQTLINRFYYDEIGRLIAETKEDANGELLYSESRTFDLIGRKLSETKGGYTTLFTYNSKGELIEKTAPDGRSTTYTYNHAYRNKLGQTVLLRRMIDPAGTVTEWEYDPYGQEVRTATFDPYSTLLQQTYKIYTVMGQLGKIVKEIYYQGALERLYETHFRYDCLGRPTQITEEKGMPHEKNTYTTYDAHGQKVKVVKPNGVSLYYDYDLRGRLIHERSCNRTVDYHITYTPASRPETVADLVHHIASHYTYDPAGRITQEMQAHGESVKNRYDVRGRLTQVTHSRSTPLTLSYDALFLRQVDWNDLTATYDSYDLSGNLIHGNDTTFAYDPAGRLTAWQKGSFSESLTYNTAGNLSSRILLGEKTDYAYDGLYQLEKEAGATTKTYAHDSHYNRRQKDGTDYTLNALHCPTAYGSATYTWDRNGNLLSRVENGCLTEYTYDARDRLIALKTDDGNIIPYLWDEQNRCLMAGTTRFLYQGRAEVGSVDNETLSTFRILGLGRGQEVGASIWMKVQDEIVAPLHDLSGNIFGLTTLSGHLAAYRPLSAFGEKLDGGFGEIPWGFCSKRREAHSGLILFGYRFYDSGLGRFTTADPAGFDAGPNLWAYCNNNPLIYGDLYGLSAHPFLEDASSEPTCETQDLDTGDSPDVEVSSFPSIETCCIGHFVCSSVKAICYGTGHGIETIAFHALPHLPGLKDIPMFIGHVLKGGCYCTYTPTKRHNISRWVWAGTNPFNPKLAAIHSCGMGTNVEEGQMRANTISKDIGGDLAHIFVPGDHGLVSNLLSCLLEYVGFSIHAEKVYKQGVEDIDAKMDKNGIKLTLCYSRGNLISLNTSHTWKAEGNNIPDSIHYIGMASPKSPNVEDYGKTTVHISSRDGVPFLMGLDRWNPPDHLHIYKSSTFPLLDHQFSGDVYFQIYKDSFVREYERLKKNL
jgi:RHS repeat-associated protein